MLHAAGNSIPLELERVIRPDGDELDVDATTFADHRRLGVTFNRLGVICSPRKLIVRRWLLVPPPAQPVTQTTPTLNPAARAEPSPVGN